MVVTRNFNTQKIQQDFSTRDFNSCAVLQSLGAAGILPKFLLQILHKKTKQTSGSLYYHTLCLNTWVCYQWNKVWYISNQSFSHLLLTDITLALSASWLFQKASWIKVSFVADIGYHLPQVMSYFIYKCSLVVVEPRLPQVPDLKPNLLFTSCCFCLQPEAWGILKWSLDSYWCESSPAFAKMS